MLEINLREPSTATDLPREARAIWTACGSSIWIAERTKLSDQAGEDIKLLTPGLREHSSFHKSYRWCWDKMHESSLFTSKPFLE
jgi:hypothetical protein